MIKTLAIDPKNTFALTNKDAILHMLGNNTTPGNATNFLQYENSTYGIKMQYPSDWQSVGGASNSSIVASFNPQGNYASYVAIQIENLSTGYTPDQYLNSLMQGDAADYKHFPDIRFSQNTTNNIVLSGHPGYLLNGTFRDPTTDALQRFTNIGTIIGDKVYSIIYYSPAEIYPVYSTIYLQMIKSFGVPLAYAHPKAGTNGIWANKTGTLVATSGPTGCYKQKGGGYTCTSIIGMQATHATNESSYQYGYKQGKNEYLNCLDSDADCFTATNDCQSVTNQTACIDGYIQAWNKVCDPVKTSHWPNNEVPCPTDIRHEPLSGFNNNGTWNSFDKRAVERTIPASLTQDQFWNQTFSFGNMTHEQFCIIEPMSCIGHPLNVNLLSWG